MYISFWTMFFIVLGSMIFGDLICCLLWVRKRPIVGVMRIDQNDPVRDRVVLEMKADPRDLVECKEAILLIDATANIPPFEKEPDDSQE